MANDKDDGGNKESEDNKCGFGTDLSVFKPNPNKDVDVRFLPVDSDAFDIEQSNTRSGRDYSMSVEVHEIDINDFKAVKQQVGGGLSGMQKYAKSAAAKSTNSVIQCQPGMGKDEQSLVFL